MRVGHTLSIIYHYKLLVREYPEPGRTQCTLTEDRELLISIEWC